MINSKSSMIQDLAQLQVDDCVTDTCIVGASDKVFIHRAMLFSAHVHPDPVWYQLDPGEGHAVVIVPDASTEDLKTLVRKLYCHGEDVFYTCVPNTPDLLTMPGTPDLFHTAVPQTPLDHPQTEHNDSSGSNKREKQQQLDMIRVRLRLLKIQKDEALAGNDKEAVINLMSSIDLTNEEKVRLEKEVEDCNTSEESFEVKQEEVDGGNNDAEVDIQTDVILEVKEEDDIDEDNNVAPDPTCMQCGAMFKSKIALVKHEVDVHKKMLKICETCGKTCDNQRALRNHRRVHKKIECDICFQMITMNHWNRHRSSCHKKLTEGQEPPGQYKCLFPLCDFTSGLESCLTKHIKKEHGKPVLLQCTHCSYSTKNKSNLNKHINYVHLVVKEECDSCNKKFNSREALERHKRNAHQVKSGTGSVLFHNLEVPKEDRWFPCNECDYKSRRKYDTEKHKKKHLKIGIKKIVHECCHCGKSFKQGAKLKKHLEKCREFVSLKVGEEEAVKLLSSGLNKTKVKEVLKFVRKVSGRSKVQTNLMKTVNESVKSLEKFFTSKKIRLKDSDGKEFVTAVAYCSDVKGYLKFIKKGRKYKNALYLVSTDGGMYII